VGSGIYFYVTVEVKKMIEDEKRTKVEAKPEEKAVEKPAEPPAPKPEEKPAGGFGEGQ
jgi:hypothetical protein